jgi:hypothetical protein
MYTEHNTPPPLKELLRDFLVSALLAIPLAALCGLIACFVWEFKTHADWIGVWPEISWKAFAIAYVMQFVFLFETKWGKTICQTTTSYLLNRQDLR